MSTPDFRFSGKHEYEGDQYAGVYPNEVLDEVKSFKFNRGDILIPSYPRQGRLWIEELVWLICNEANIEEANKTNVRLRVKPIEIAVPGIPSNVEVLSAMESPRIMSSFLQYKFYKDCLPNKGVKTIYVLRNPKDTLVSYYHFNRMCAVVGNFPGSWDEFFDHIKAKTLNLGDLINNIASWLENLGNPDFLLVQYEDLKEDLPSQMTRIADFLGKSLSDDQLKAIVNHTTFEQMSQNPCTNMTTIGSYHQNVSPFLRKGAIGDWKNYFSESQNEYLDELIERKLGSYGITFKYE